MLSRHLLPLMRVGVVVVDAQRLIRYAIGHVRHWVGQSTCELLDQRFELLIHPEDRQHFIDRFAQLLSTGDAAHGVGVRLIGPGGAVRHVDIQMHDLRKTEAVSGVVLEMQNVSDCVRMRQVLREAATEYLGIFDNAVSGIYQVSPHGHIIAANPALASMLGYDSADQLIAEVSDFRKQLYMDPADHQRFMKLIHEHGMVRNLEVRLRRRDGSSIWVIDNARAIMTEQGEIGYFQGIVQDISGLVAARSELSASEAKYRTLAERYELAMAGAKDGIWDWNLKTGDLYFSPRWSQILGDGERERVGSREDWLDRVFPDDRQHLIAEWQAHISGHSSCLEIEFRMRHRDGHYIWVLCRGLRVCESDGTARRMAGSLSDVTTRKTYEQRLVHDAFHDTLTGLPNRALFLDRLERAVARRRREHEDECAVLFLDMDNFKVVNDSLGHLAGDRLLIAVAQRLMGCLRPGDTVARLGGDEFVILLDGVVGTEDAVFVAERVHRELDRPFRISGQDVYAATSIGIAISARGYDDPEHLLRDADTAMYRAKSHGVRNEVFDLQMHAGAVARLKLETDLRHGLEQDAFFVCYQPVVNLSDGRIHGFEALARWSHPDGGVGMPADFIETCEQTGLIVGLGKSILHQACRQVQYWREQLAGQLTHLPWVSVNLSIQQVQHSDLVATVREVLTGTGLPAEALKLEITESMTIADPGLVIDTMNQLHAMGVQLIVDDFGTGYSSFVYLDQLPASTLKIDRSFIQRKEYKNKHIVQAITSLAHNLSMSVVAEGIEQREQLEDARSRGIEYGQGFWFARPMIGPEAGDLLKKDPQW